MRIGIVVTLWHYVPGKIPKHLLNVFKSLNMQDIDGKIDVLFVDNQSSDSFLSALNPKCQEYSNDKVSFSYISEKDYYYHFSSMNLGFYVLNQHAHYDVFGYSADDIYFTYPDGLRKAIEKLADPEVALVSAQCDYDNAPKELIHYNSAQTMKVRLGECVNLHLMLFSRKYMEAYDFRYPDMIQSWGSESLLTYMCAAIDKCWTLCCESKSSNAKKWNKNIRSNKKKGMSGYMTYSGISFEGLFQEGSSVGMGFQDFLVPYHRKSYCQSHDPSLYDENGKCKDRDKLLLYIKNNLFVKPTNYQERFMNDNQMFGSVFGSK